MTAPAKPDPLGVECERCGSRPYTPCCVKRLGAIRPAYFYGPNDFHAARVRLAEKEARDER